MGLVVSFTADAGQNASIGASLAPLSMRAPDQPADLVPLGGAPGNFELEQPLLQEARFVVGAPDEFAKLPDEIEPRQVLKRDAQTGPQLDRSHKSDPFVGLRPTFDTRLRRPGGLVAFRAHDLLFVHDDALPTGALSAADGDVDGPESVASFEPWGEGENPTTVHSDAATSPATKGAASTLTVRPAALNERLMQGATPGVSRAAALGSTTPAPADATPIEVTALPQMPPETPNATTVPQGQRNYAALIEPDRQAREKRCLAEAVYFEARSEPEEGQAAVAQVVLNRVASGLYPSTICGVVYQNRQRYHACQFSFACEGRSLRVTEPDAWRTAVAVADAVSAGRTYVADVGDATHYHANYVRPRWARSLEKMDVIGHHIFYKLRPGQT
jgi:spore germination cell wall hydrolase CwlJ-like protein